MSKHHHSFHIHLSKKKRKTAVDKIAMVASLMYPLSGIPQLISVYHGEVEGVSILSWLAFSFFSFLFLLYGIYHKIKPMIIVNLLWFVIDVAIVIGILKHHMM